LAIVIEPYQQKHEAAVDDFNRRLQAGGADADLVFYRWAKPRFLPKTEGTSLYNEFFVAVDGNKVRGGYALKHQDFVLPGGTVRSLGYYHHPLSEGIVDKTHALIGTLLLRDAMQRSPMLYCLGMGGYDRPLPRMLLSLGWTRCLVPFYFRVVNPARFLREMQALRTSPWLKFLMDLGAGSGAGSATLAAWNAVTKLRAPRRPSSIHAEVVQEFSDWADTIWHEAKSSYSIAAIRNTNTLKVLYPGSDTHFTRLRVQAGNKDIGWAVVGEKRKDPKYGNMRVGSIVDCWARPADALAVTAAASETLETQGFDLIVSNQSHENWGRALQATGFLKAPSNFVFAASKKLAESLQPFEETRPRMHFLRADGDGLPRNF
jgi:hypothetical protein